MTQLYYYNQIIKLSADFELTDFESFHTVFCFLNILIGFKFTLSIMETRNDVICALINRVQPDYNWLT